MVNDEPIKNPTGSATVLLIRKSKLYFFPRFCDPRQRKKISNIAEQMLSVRSCNLKNIFKIFHFLYFSKNVYLSRFLCNLE